MFITYMYTHKMDALGNMDYAKFEMMSIESLRIYLFMRNKSSEGDFRTLVSRTENEFTPPITTRSHKIYIKYYVCFH